MDYIPGQRIINNAELQLGLGTVLSVEHRTLTVLFMASGETRTYARDSAPLIRVRFHPGDEIATADGMQFRVTGLQEVDGLIHYRCEGGQEVPESFLDPMLKLNRPADRLLTRQVDKDKWFSLRYQTLLHRNKLQASPIRGLCGGRTSLIPHQLYVAHEVANRHAPRVLLADEVGLGKTIEAGMILHQQLLSERAQRVLIVVPESLIHQWLVEMKRRFNLDFSIFNEARCAALESRGEEGAEPVEETIDVEPAINPFHSEQLVLVGLDFLARSPQRFQQALDGEWDMLVVDEAHHLQWSEQSPSREYELVEQLATRTQGVLLLTATPEQLGKASHFARLRLLDPDRFASLQQFEAEEQGYEPIARVVQELLEDQTLSAKNLNTLQGLLDAEDQGLLQQLQQGQEAAQARNDLIEHLLDRHGTGRVLFRNTRSAVKGFPQRIARLYPLPLPGAYAQMLAALQGEHINEAQLLLSPELVYQAMGPSDERSEQGWQEIDPRVDWLIDQLRALRPAKVLVICASADTALELAEALRVKQGIQAAVFHEGLTLLERDRAAAWFADREYGAQVLIASEIGSEGRNFQFAHHLVLFDLPFNPDLLEQRIGRLDRIGQTEDIKLHIPYLQDSPQQLMVQWYAQGLNAFAHTCPAGYGVFSRLEQELLANLQQYDDAEQGQALIETTRQLHEQLNQALHQGRDRLLEFNSCRSEAAEELMQQARAQDKTMGLHDYLENVYNCLRIDSEIHSAGAEIIRAGEHMPMQVPGLDEEGMTITLDRERALANEDMQFITWEHPFLNTVMDLILSGEKGNTALCALKYSGVKPGSILLECLYVLETRGQPQLQSNRYLPDTTLRVLLDESGEDHNHKLPHQLIQSQLQKVDKKVSAQLIAASEEKLRPLLSRAEVMAQQQAEAIKQQAHEQARLSLQSEINRLKALQQHNPSVRDEEIAFVEQQWQGLDTVLQKAGLRLDAVRVVVVV